MHLDCCFRDPEVTGNLFVQLAGDDVLEQLPLARCERVEARADLGEFSVFAAGDSVPFNGGANSRNQIFSVHGFGKEIKRATFHRLHTLGNITMATEENNRKDTASLAQYRLELETIEAGHRQIKHKTTCRIRVVLREKFRGRLKDGHRDAGRTQ